MSQSHSPDRKTDLSSPRSAARKDDSFHRYLAISLAALVVISLMLLPAFTGDPPKTPDPAQLRAYTRPFRDVFASVLWWLQVAKWVSAAIFLAVVAVAILKRMSGKAATSSPERDTDPGDRS